MPFFIRGKRPGSHKEKKKGFIKKRKGQDEGAVKKAKYAPNLDEEITSDEDEQLIPGKRKYDEDVEFEDTETVQEKKVRLARQYLQELQAQKIRDEEDEELDEAAIGLRLREDVLEASGRLQRSVAHTYSEPTLEDISVLKCKHQRLPITCVAITADGKHIFSGSKDCSIVKWTVDGQRECVIPGGRKGTEDSHKGHTSHIYSMDVSSDGMFLATGDKGGYINIWNAETMEHLKKFKKHRGSVSGLAFRHATHTLYSASFDRMVMVWNLDAMALVEHLGGHQDAITGIDALTRESCITSGSRDQSIIVYVIVDDKQLRFSGHHDSIDGVKLLNDKTFIAFSQDGALSLWTTLKKRPHCVIRAAHGHQDINSLPKWITAVGTLVNSDLIASGSWDGYVRLWKVDTVGHRKLEPLFSIPVSGVINSLAFSTNGKYLIVGVGQEHKLGRWFKEKEAKNSVVVISLRKIDQRKGEEGKASVGGTEEVFKGVENEFGNGERTA